ncbi:hypothetical protein Tco_1103189 [Tanacetum coccineum]
MLVENKYPLKKEVLLQMLKLKLESEEDNTMALELIRFVKKQIAELELDNSDGDEKHKNWLVHKQTACGKDFLNPFVADNLPKIVWLSTHHIYVCEELASPQDYAEKMMLKRVAVLLKRKVADKEG